MSWNGHPSYVCNAILRKLRERTKNTNGHCSDSEDDDTTKIWFRVPYIGPIGEKFDKNVFRNFENVILMYDTNKFAFLSLTRTLWLFIYNHMPYISLYVPDVMRYVLENRQMF